MQRPRVAIIGAGIFGISCAVELAEMCEVVVYEQNSEIMSGGTYGSQRRHHYGYHYPRSPETVRQCQVAEKDFIDVWGAAIVDGFPAYYAIAKENSLTTAEQFFAFCEALKLPYEISYPSEEFLDRSRVVTCVKTKEPAYDYFRLRELAKDKILSNPHIQIKLRNTVVGCEFSETDNTKHVLVKAAGEVCRESFDFVINATYANHNVFCNWLGFAVPSLEFRLKELVIVELPRPQLLAVTVMDGPFVTIIPVGDSGRYYTLGDAKRSIHDIKFSPVGPPWSKADIAGRVSRFPEMRENNPFFIPIIKDAKYIKSIFSILPILPNLGATDERITSVTDHGRGCWSVFEGKIITCVTAAKKIKLALQKQW